MDSQSLKECEGTKKTSTISVNSSSLIDPPLVEKSGQKVVGTHMSYRFPQIAQQQWNVETHGSSLRNLTLCLLYVKLEIVNNIESKWLIRWQGNRLKLIILR